MRRSARSSAAAARDRRSALDVERALALAEAKLGDLAARGRAPRRGDRAQLALGVAGLNLGTSYEARARIAIWAGDGRGREPTAAWPRASTATATTRRSARATNG